MAQGIQLLPLCRGQLVLNNRFLQRRACPQEVGDGVPCCAPTTMHSVNGADSPAGNCGSHKRSQTEVTRESKSLPWPHLAYPPPWCQNQDLTSTGGTMDRKSGHLCPFPAAPPGPVFPRENTSSSLGCSLLISKTKERGGWPQTKSPSSATALSSTSPLVQLTQVEDLFPPDGKKDRIRLKVSKLLEND